MDILFCCAVDKYMCKNEYGNENIDKINPELFYKLLYESTTKICYFVSNSRYTQKKLIQLLKQFGFSKVDPLDKGNGYYQEFILYK